MSPRVAACRVHDVDGEPGRREPLPRLDGEPVPPGSGADSIAADGRCTREAELR
ncbi:hypothetical protein ACH4TP_00390 [Streptomyces sp. NPDC021012]|uniref:hypothetical protein n=1 Tax=Streptomyces sp. NPDC021012 TaxID=3365107 RepID=UPI0037B08F89